MSGQLLVRPVYAPTIVILQNTQSVAAERLLIAGAHSTRSV